MKGLIVILTLVLAGCSSINSEKVKEKITICEKISDEWRLVQDGFYMYLVCGGVEVHLKGSNT